MFDAPLTIQLSYVHSGIVLNIKDVIVIPWVVHLYIEIIHEL